MYFLYYAGQPHQNIPMDKNATFVGTSLRDVARA